MTFTVKPMLAKKTPARVIGKGYWLQKNGKTIKVADMEESHIQNTIAMLRRKVDKETKELEKARVGFEPVPDTLVKPHANINMLVKELKRRGFVERQLNDWNTSIEVDINGPGYERVG